MALTNSTVSGNDARVRGGGISGFYGTVTNTIVAGNSAVVTGANCDSAANSPFGFNLTDDTSCGFSAAGDLVVADAMLGPLQDNGGPTETHALLAGSPAINAASCGFPPPTTDTDQRGVLRPQGAACDIGAFEVEVAASIPALSPFGRAAFVILLFAAMIGALRVRRREPRSE
jgi:hypothetical protein